MERAIIVKKEKEVKELATKIKDSASIVVVDYRGLTVEQITTLRSNLREEGCEMKVIKNNYTRRAVESIGHKELVEHLIGPNAIAFSKDDSIAAAKILYNFSKENKKLELKAGLIDGEFSDLDKLIEYAKLPSRDTLLTMLAGSLLSPLRDITIGLNMISEQEATEEKAEAKEETKKEEKVEAKEEVKEEKVEAKEETKKEEKVEAKEEVKTESKEETKENNENEKGEK